jgi:hypothetical protein
MTTRGAPLPSTDRAPVAQLDRASVYGTEGRRFESCRACFTIRLPEGICGLWRTPSGGSRAGRRAGRLPARVEVRPRLPRRWPPAQAGCRDNGRRSRNQAAARRRGACTAARPTLHEFSLAWLDRYAGTGHASVRDSARREYRRLLVNFALTYFDHPLQASRGDVGDCSVSREGSIGSCGPYATAGRPSADSSVGPVR